MSKNDRRSNNQFVDNGMRSRGEWLYRIDAKVVNRHMLRVMNADKAY